MNPSDIFTAYFAQGQHLAALVTPYAMHLLYLLVFVEVLTISITYMMGGSENPSELLWQIGRLLFTGGFAYGWLVNCWALGVTVLGSFNQLGQNITGVPGLTPSAFISVATQICKILWSAPSSTRLLPNLGLEIGEFMLAIMIMLIFLIIAGLAIFTIASMWLILGPGSIVIGFLPCRFTSSLTEGYFTWLI